MRDQREVFPGLDSGPNGSEGHYSMPPGKTSLWSLTIYYLKTQSGIQARTQGVFCFQNEKPAVDTRGQSPQNTYFHVTPDKMAFSNVFLSDWQPCLFSAFCKSKTVVQTKVTKHHQLSGIFGGF